MEVDLTDLESSIKRLPGVLGCAILATAEGLPPEVQAFTRSGIDTDEVRRAISAEIEGLGLDALGEVLVFELEAESHFGDRESLLRAAQLAEQEARIRGPVAPRPPGVPLGARERPSAAPGESRRYPLRRVVLTSAHGTTEAQVALGEEAEAVGRAVGDGTPHGLHALGEATLEAVATLAGGLDLRLEGASLVEVEGRHAVVVLVRVDGEDNVGAALVRKGPVSEAAVRATLDAVNRRLDRVS